jgi:uncharacterized membrane protein
MESQLSVPGDGCRSATETMNPYETPDAESTLAVENRSWLLYVPAAFCWLAAIVFIGIAVSFTKVAYTNSLSVTGSETTALWIIASVFNLTCLGCAYACFRTGKRSATGRWKSGVLITLVCFGILYLVALLIIRFIQTYFPYE